MTETEVEAALGRDITQRRSVGGECGTARFGGRDYLLFTKDWLRRITLGSKRHETAKGLAVGDRQSSVRKAYGKRAKRSPHTYAPDGFYFDVQNAKRGLRFETDGRRITYIHAGRLPELNYVEACSSVDRKRANRPRLPPR